MPPLDGSITVLPGFIDFQATNNPNRTCVKFPSSDGVSNISYQEFANATHRVAHALRPGRRGEEGEMVALVIHTDALFYMALLAGMSRAGLVSFPMSPRNSAAAIVNMLEKTSCHRLITQPSLSAVISEVKATLAEKGYALQVDALPDFQDVFPTIRHGVMYHDAVHVDPYPERKEPLGTDVPVTYLHSSGSTGFPKPIPQTQNTLLSWCHNDAMYGARMRQVQWGCMALPTFHSFGYATQFLAPFSTSCSITLYEPKSPLPPVVPSAQNVLQISMLTKSTGIPAVPSMVETWAHSDEAIKYLATLDVLVYAGGPLSKKAGDKLVAAGVKLTSVYGATEFGSVALAYYPDKPEDASYDIRAPQDWEWLQMNPRYTLRWIPQGDGTYELHVLASEKHTLSIMNLPDVEGYATSDLFEPHPTKDGLWKITGRKDDVITLSSGEKIVPISQESHLLTNSMVTGAMIFGRGKEQAGLLIELHPEYAIDPNDEQALAEFRNKIWHTVEEANQLAPAFAKIYKEMIIVAAPTKPLPRPAKGTLARKQAVKEFEQEIEALYAAVENSSGIKTIVPPKSWSPEDIEAWLCEHAAAINDERRFDPSIDLFQQGLDSLGATFLRNRIIGALRASGSDYTHKSATNLSQNFIFDHPSIRSMAQAIADFADPSSSTTSSLDASAQILAMIDKYGSGIQTVTRMDATPQDNVVVLLTGTTGNIGSHILATLLADGRVSKVYALNRSGSHSEVGRRQRAAFEDRGLPVDLLSEEKFIPLTGDLTRERFGLGEYFDEIRNTVTHVVHNAWTVHFKHTLLSFENQLAGLRQLVDFCLSLGHPIRVQFVSSVSVASAWPLSKGKVPEEPLPSAESAMTNGYAMSKYVAEQVLAKASNKGLTVTSLRVGQVCGSKSTGAWNTTDWVPILLKSSTAIGCLPNLAGSASWIPMDAVAQLCSDLVFTTNAPPRLVNVVHPDPVTWRHVFEAINSSLDADLPFVPMAQWLGKLEALAGDLGSQKHLDKVPALSLLEFFRGMATSDQATSNGEAEAGGLPLFETSVLQQSSETMNRLPKIDESYARMWVRYWRSRSFL
ncbi:hypothetical protein EIP86_009494 [Pleurotus ostreatoroseus]|nr:hypothetical protein EIP86_009494 [Pleurotus ostreatoroseus]